MKYQAGPGRHRRVSASPRTLISRFSKIPCSIDELSSPLSLSYFWRSLLVCVFYGRLALTNCVCLGISGRRFPLIQTGGMRLFGQGGHGFWISGPRAGEAGVLVRLWIGVFLSWLSAWQAMRMKVKAKLKMAFSYANERGLRISIGRKRYYENRYGHPF